MAHTASTVIPHVVEHGLDIVAAVAGQLQVMLVVGPAGPLSHYQYHESLGKLLDDVSDKFGVALHAVQLISSLRQPLLDGLSLRKLHEHALYENTLWNHKNRVREAANDVHVQAGEQFADQVLARILGCPLDMSIAETLGRLPVVHALASFNPQGPVRKLSLVMSNASVEVPHRGSCSITITITRNCTWRHLKEKLAKEFHWGHPHEIVFLQRGRVLLLAQEFENVWEMVPEGDQVSFRLSGQAGDLSFFRMQRMPAAEQIPGCASAAVSLQSMAWTFERKQPGIALRLTALNVSTWRPTEEPGAEPFIPGTNAAEWSTSGGICVEQLPLLAFATEPVIQVWPRQWLLEVLRVLKTTGLTEMLRRSIVRFCALPPEQWWHGRQVAGHTTFSWQCNPTGNDSLLASFVPKEPLLPGVLSVSSFGLKTGSPTAGRQQEISIAWLVKVSGGSHRSAGPFPAFDAIGNDYGGDPVIDGFHPGDVPAAWLL